MGRVNRLEGWRDADGSEGEDVQPDPFDICPRCHGSISQNENCTYCMTNLALAKFLELFSRDNNTEKLHSAVQEQWPW